MHKTDSTPASQPRVLDPVNVMVEDGPRLVTFSSRPKLAIHPVAIAVPWAVLKATVAEIMSYEAKAEMAAHGSAINTQRVDGTAGVQ